MKIVHLIDCSAPGGGGATMCLLRDLEAAQPSLHHVCLAFGTAAHADLASRIGLRLRGLLPVVPGWTWSAARSMRRVLRGIAAPGRADDPGLEATRAAAFGRPDALVAWTLPSLQLARRVAGTIPVHACLTTGPVDDGTIDRLLALRAPRPVSVTALTATVAADVRCVLGGWPVDPVVPWIDPADAARRRGQRAALRTRYGVGEDVLVIGLLADPIFWPDAMQAVGIAARLAATGRRVRLVVAPRAMRRSQAERWICDVGRRDLLTVDDAISEPWSVLPALDVALLIGGVQAPAERRVEPTVGTWLLGGRGPARPDPGVLPALHAAAAGVPVIADDLPALRHVVHEGETGLLVSPFRAVDVVERLIRLYDDPALRARLGGTARSVVERDHASCRVVPGVVRRWLPGAAPQLRAS
ncbi:MAG: glycosyltransferase [Phycisphaeraceae bacterium]|nr:glycosyltransferase [Phycisphaeraceae bacterium]